MISENFYKKYKSIITKKKEVEEILLDFWAMDVGDVIFFCDEKFVKVFDDGNKVELVSIEAHQYEKISDIGDLDVQKVRALKAECKSTVPYIYLFLGTKEDYSEISGPLFVDGRIANEVFEYGFRVFVKEEYSEEDKYNLFCKLRTGKTLKCLNYKKEGLENELFGERLKFTFLTSFALKNYEKKPSKTRVKGKIDRIENVIPNDKIISLQRNDFDYINAKKEIEGISNRVKVDEFEYGNEKELNELEYLTTLVNNEKNILLFEDLYVKVFGAKRYYEVLLEVDKEHPSVEKQKKKEQLKKLKKEIGDEPLLEEKPDESRFVLLVSDNSVKTEPEKPEYDEPKPEFIRLKPVLLNMEPVRPQEPNYEPVRFFGKSKILQRNEELKASYEEKLEHYHKEKEEYEKALKEYNQKSEEYNIAFNDYQQQLQEYEERSKRFLVENMPKYEEQLNAYNEYASQLKNYQEEVDRYEKILLERKDWEKKKKKIAKLEKELNYDNENNPIKIKLDVYVEQLKALTDYLVALYSVKELLLRMNVVFSKYDSLPSWAKFLEYFQTGRVNALAGNDGAYNLYESELRADTIITKLDVVIDKLDEIRDNQYVLYSAIKENTDALKKIDEKISLGFSGRESQALKGAKVDAELNAIYKNRIKGVSASTTYLDKHYLPSNSSNGTKKIISNAILGGIVAGPAGAVVGGLVGMNKAK